MATLNPSDIAGQLAASADRLKSVNQGVEALRRARKIMARCYPDAPIGNPFVNEADRAWFMSPERGDYVLLQRRMFKEIQGRLLAKIAAHSAYLGEVEDIARASESYVPARAA